MASSTNKKKGITPVSSYKKARKGFELEMPSGNVCLVRLPGLPQILAEGLLPDSLSGIVQQQINSRSASKGIEEPQTMEEISEMFDSFDRIAVRCLVEPSVTFYKDEDGKIIPEDDRDEELLYSDEIDLDDKIFLFNVVSGGTKDLEKFRQEFGENVGSVSSGDDV